MGSIADHKRRIQENIEEIESTVAVGIEKKPVTMGMHVSACSVELLELYLHKTGKIPIGKVIKHDWFKRPLPGQKVEPMIERKLKADFLRKEEIYDLFYTIEENRNNLIYGRATKHQVELVFNSFMKLREILTGLAGDLYD